MEVVYPESGNQLTHHAFMLLRKRQKRATTAQSASRDRPVFWPKQRALWKQGIDTHHEARLPERACVGDFPLLELSFLSEPLYNRLTFKKRIPAKALYSL